MPVPCPLQADNTTRLVGGNGRLLRTCHQGCDQLGHKREVTNDNRVATPLLQLLYKWFNRIVGRYSLDSIHRLVGSQQFKLFLQDQDFLEEFLEKKWGRKIFFVWWLLADCGRSLGRWAGWSLLLALLFAFLFWHLGSNSFDTQHLEFNLLTMFYYSVVTFTTLGFGDIIPKTTIAAMCVTVEVILGYVMLGGLITIFASKLSRRGA